jgi:hypothetical protein
MVESACKDNAVIEAWHSTLTFEFRALEHFVTEAAVRARSSSGSTNTTVSAALGLRGVVALMIGRHG